MAELACNNEWQYFFYKNSFLYEFWSPSFDTCQSWMKYESSACCQSQYAYDVLEIIKEALNTLLQLIIRKSLRLGEKEEKTLLKKGLKNIRAFQILN